MTTLKELQETFQRGILARDDKILSEVNDSGKNAARSCSTSIATAMSPDSPRSWARTMSAPTNIWAMPASLN